MQVRIEQPHDLRTASDGGLRPRFLVPSRKLHTSAKLAMTTPVCVPAPAVVATPVRVATPLESVVAEPTAVPLSK